MEMKNMKKRNKMNESRRDSGRSGGNIDAGINGINVATPDDDTIFDILSRLPAKTLLRFKCVCKPWRSLIQYDPFFRDLHVMRSKKFQGGNKKILFISSITDNLHGRITFIFTYWLPEKEGLDVVKRKLELDCSTNDFVPILKPVNGLVCVCQCSRASVLIYNPSTGERTSWIQSITSNEKTEEGIMKKACSYGFGVDPTTNEFKVVCIWKMFADGGFKGTYEVKEVGQFCEVLTLGENGWRKIDEEVPPYNLRDNATYANGSIYWRYCGESYFGPEVLIEFDLVKEKFRVIPIPDFVIDPERYKTSKEMVKLLEVDGRIAVVDWVSNYQINLWRYNDEDEYRTSDWIKEIIQTPFMSYLEQVFIEAIHPELIFLCELNRKEAYYQQKEVYYQLRNAGLRANFKINCDDTKGLRWITNFVENFNFLPVQKHHLLSIG